MITNRVDTAVLFQAAYDACRNLDRALREIASRLPPEELAAGKQAVGKVMGELLFEITEPILKRHPELLPDDWREANESNSGNNLSATDMDPQDGSA